MIIPLLPLFVYGIFLKIAADGQVGNVMGVFIKIIILIFLLTVVLLMFQFMVAGLVARKNPFPLLRTMLTAYVTALGTQSSAATIPVTLQQAIKCGVDPKLPVPSYLMCDGTFVGSMLKITACAMAVMLMSGIPIDTFVFTGLFSCWLLPWLRHPAFGRPLWRPLPYCNRYWGSMRKLLD